MGPATMSWSLPASNSDARANDVERTHQCGCTGESSWGAPCALWGTPGLPPSRISGEDAGSNFEPYFPLFPTEDGGVATKDAMTTTIVEAARFLGQPLEYVDGSEQVSGIP